MSQPHEQSIPELRDSVLNGLDIGPGNTTALIGRGLLILGVEIVDCLRGIETAVAALAEPSLAAPSKPKRKREPGESA